MRYVRIRAWHVIWRDPSDDARVWNLLIRGSYRTRCGRAVSKELDTVESLPMGEKSCESCLRLTLHDEEKESGT